MSYSKDELIPPKWIDRNYLENVIRKNCNDFVEVIDYTISPASFATDHFASLIFRVRLQMKTTKTFKNSVSVIIKALPTEDGLKKDIIDSYDVFAVEVSFFADILPECHRILDSIGCTDRIAAKMLYQSDVPQPNIVLQDLTELGYAVSKTNYPCTDFYKQMFRKLAKLHATTFKMHSDGNTDVTKFKGVCLNMPGLRDILLYRSGKELLAEVMQTIPELKQYAEKMKSICINDLVEKCIEVINKCGSYNVLNHGDLYVKNLMMRNEENKTDIVFVDFQLCHWGSPAVDIAYIGAFIPFEERDEIIRDYFEAFIDILKRTGYNGQLPTFEQLQIDLEERRALEFYLLILSGPFMNEDVANITADRLNIDLFMADPEFIKESFRCEQYIALLKQLLPVYFEDDYFDQLS